MKKMILATIISISSLSANWETEIKINPIDDTNIVSLKLNSKNDKNGNLYLECNNEKEVSISLFSTGFNSASLFSEPKVIIRFGKEKAITTLKRDSLYYKNPKEFIQKLLDNKTNIFVWKEGSSDAYVFDTAGLNKVIKPLKDACSW